jgi:hypothetical protein
VSIVDDKSALVLSNAGMRLIALQTLLNKGDFARLETYIRDNFTAAALEAQPVEDRLAELRAAWEHTGKLRVYQVIGTDKHQVIVLLEAQQAPGFFLHELTVEEDYPHKITAYTFQTLGEAGG